ncbi:MAG: ArsC/Spx/MgsR family protein [Chitinophagaceae bacterium]|jgi:arsenate reductase
MPNRIYYLSTCSTCSRIIKDLDITADNFKLQDIKTNKITARQLDEMKALSGSYESLFSRRSLQYAARGLKDKTLTEQDYSDLILEEYTFLKRPVAIVGKEIFIGNTKETVAALKEKLAQ